MHGKDDFACCYVPGPLWATGTSGTSRRIRWRIHVTLQKNPSTSTVAISSYSRRQCFLNPILCGSLEAPGFGWSVREVSKRLRRDFNQRLPNLDKSVSGSINQKPIFEPEGTGSRGWTQGVSYSTTDPTESAVKGGGACVLQGLRRIFHRGRCRREQRVVVSTLSFDGTTLLPPPLRQSLFPRDLNSPPPNHPEHPRILGLSSGCIPSKIASYPFCQSSAGAAGFLVSSNRCMRVPWGTPDCPYRHNASKSKLTCSLLGCPAQLRQGPHHTKALPRAGSQSCLFCRDFAAGRRNSTCTGNAPRFAALEGVPKFGRRQAHGVFELDAPGSSTPASLVCRGGAASRRVLRHNVWISRDVPISTVRRRGANCFDTMYRVPASGHSTLRIWPPAGKWCPQAQRAGYSTRGCLVRRRGAAKRRRMPRHHISRSRERCTNPVLAASRHIPTPRVMSRVRALAHPGRCSAAPEFRIHI
ncbi:hypothetical protein C8R47DRAFT_1076887 [Mycena vitilis]|nr:hypothetical protein C8R47DRAFT_1076887 [Mycena vitilis]